MYKNIKTLNTTYEKHIKHMKTHYKQHIIKHIEKHSTKHEQDINNI